ncbi:DNA polymerase III subunit beta [Paenibacillus barcinonensis]|uniref:Beta sliding clamp n=1 Tax=Paenibacillus barcinonensis TaxID=198119 RepID=A0A2V4VWR0_PAEBA|nr:DNA polymerase III subunit beta [Paenibacillus barcinonensis]PYE49638.1 DNA polymerase III beta subunit [Paenibacillus barcinonensis]QKS56654.1 DNA polymerase III subunit beta [Paenibacillus barcinonensis]
MRVVINRVRLLEQLTRTVRFVSSNEAVRVLECVYIKAGTDRISMIGGEGNSFFVTEMHTEHVQIQQTGRIVVQAKLLADIVRKMQESEIVLSNEEKTDRLSVTTPSARSTFVLQLLSADEYPLPERMEEQTLFTIPGEHLKAAIRQTLFAIQKKEQMPILTGVKMEIQNNTLIMIGCDRYRMGKVEQALMSEMSVASETAIVPGRALNELEKLLGDESVHVRLCKSKIEFNCNDFTLLTHSITGTYPNVDIDVEGPYAARFIIQKSVLISALERVAIIAAQEKTNLIKMWVRAEQVQFSASSQVNQALETLDIDQFLGVECKVSLNVGYALEALKALDTAQVQVQINQGLQMVLFTSQEKKGVLQLIMAARTAG